MHYGIYHVVVAGKGLSVHNGIVTAVVPVNALKAVGGGSGYIIGGVNTSKLAGRILGVGSPFAYYDAGSDFPGKALKACKNGLYSLVILL